MWRQTLAILAGVLATFASAARAEPSPSLQAALTMQPGRDECIAAPALRARVQRWLKPGALQAGVTVVVNAASQPLSFSLERGGSVVAKRNFDVLPAACDDRLDAVALAITLAIEHASARGVSVPDASTPGASAPAASTPAASTPGTTAESPGSAEPANGPDAKNGQPEATAPAKPQKPTQAEAVPSTETPTDTAPTKGSAGHLRLEAGATWLLEALPDPALAISAGVEWALIGPVQLELAGLFAPQSQTTLGQGSAHTQLFGGRALACLSGPAARFGLEGCAGAAGGVARAKGFLPVRETATMAWVAGVLRVALRYPADTLFSVRVAADGLANVVRPKLEVSGPGAPRPEYAFPLGFAGSLELLFALP